MYSAFSAPSFQGGGPPLKLGVAGVDASLVFDEIAREQHLFFFHPGDGVATGVTGARVPDGHFHAAQINLQAALAPRLAVANHQRRPGEARHRIGATEQAREALHFALYVLRAALHDELMGAPAGADFGLSLIPL